MSRPIVQDQDRGRSQTVRPQEWWICLEYRVNPQCIMFVFNISGVGLISERRLSMLQAICQECHRQRTLTKPSIKTFLQTGGDDLVDLNSPGWLPYTEICGNLILAWTTFLNLLPIVYYGGGWFVALRTTLVHALLMMMRPNTMLIAWSTIL